MSKISVLGSGAIRGCNLSGQILVSIGSIASRSTDAWLELAAESRVKKAGGLEKAMYTDFGLFIVGVWTKSTKTVEVFSPVIEKSLAETAASEAPFRGTNISGLECVGGPKRILDYRETKLAQILF